MPQTNRILFWVSAGLLTLALIIAGLSLPFAISGADKSDTSGVQIVGDDACATLIVQAPRGAIHRPMNCATEPISAHPPPDSARIAVGSLTKMFTAVLTLALSAEGTLSLDDSLSRYIHELDGAALGGLQLRHLLLHTSGLDANQAHTRSVDTVRTARPDALALYRDLDVLYPPGLVYHYSSANYNLLALAVERATGQSLDQLLTRYVFAPLAMDNSGMIFDPAVAASLHPTGPDHTHRGPSGCDLVSPGAGGSAYSTISDLSAFARWLANGSADQENALLAAARDSLLGASIPSGSRYGFGFFTAAVTDLNAKGKHRYLFHDSRICGYVAHVGAVPELKLAVLLVSTSATEGRCLDNTVREALFREGLQIEGALQVDYEVELSWRAYLHKSIAYLRKLSFL